MMMCDGDGMPMMSIDNDDKMLGGHEGSFSGELHCWTDGNQPETIHLPFDVDVDGTDKCIARRQPALTHDNNNLLFMEFPS